MTKLTAIPKSWFSWDVQGLNGTRQVAEIDLAYGQRESLLSGEGAPYRVFREGMASGAYVLQDAGGRAAARAEKPSAFSRCFVIEHAGRRMVLEAISPFGRAFVLTERDAEVGSVRPEGFVSRRATASFPEDLPLPVKVFMLWLVIILWRRNADSEGSTA